MGPKPPALLRAQRRRTRPMRSKKGAEMPCRKRMVSMPRRMTKTLRSQKSTKQPAGPEWTRSEEHTSELQSRQYLVCRLLLEKKKEKTDQPKTTYTTR